jgi:transposase
VSAKQKNMVTSSSRLKWVNLIAALTSDGEVLYTVNIGKTNSYTFGFFLTKLVSYLDNQDPQWRKNSIIMIDNASYHRGVPTLHQIEMLKLPVLFLGPYHFRMAPVEMLFNYIKSHDLNPLRTRLTSRYEIGANAVGNKW